MNKIENNYLTVSEINSLIKDTIEGSLPFWLRIRGEISSFKIYPSAAYFDIKDEKSVLNCIIWSSNLQSLKFLPKVGDLVDIEGNVNVYVARGKYSFIAKSIRLAGEGEALINLEKLKKKLAAEGLFDEDKKRPIPLFPKAIGIICARESAALSDLIKNLGRRWPLAEIYFFPSLVQGEGAPESLLKAYSLSQKYDIDTLIVARGGGSNEDLNAFNNEKIVRALSTSKMPIISAVGHEIDFTLVDFVSDLRVSTPTGAAEAATPNEEDVLETIAESEKRLLSAMKKIVDTKEEMMKLLTSRSFFVRPQSIYDAIEEKVTSCGARLFSSIVFVYKSKAEKTLSIQKHLASVNPYSILKRGYSIVTTKNGKTIKSVSDIAIGTDLNIRVNDGIISAKVEAANNE